MSSPRNSQHADIPEYGVRNRSQHSRHLHRKDAESDQLEPACNQKHVVDAEFKDAHIPTLQAFERFSLCQNPECFGDDPNAEQDETELLADGGEQQFWSECFICGSEYPVPTDIDEASPELAEDHDEGCPIRDHLIQRGQTKQSEGSR